MLKNYLHIIRGVLLAVIGIIACFALHAYLNWKSPVFLLAIMAIVAAWQTTPTRKPLLRCVCLSLVCWVIYWRLPVYTVCYFGLLFAAGSVIESGGRRISILTFLAAFLAAPVFDYFANVFTFPIRLWFSTVVGKSIAIFSPAVKTQGNVILLNNNEFSVDAACMGLNMMITSLLCGIILIAIFQKRFNKRLSLGWVTVLLTLIVLLNIFSNLFRMVVLVLMAIPPENPAHELVGICALLIYVLLPAYLLSKWIVKRYGKLQPDEEPVVNAHHGSLFLPLALVLGVSWIVNTHREKSIAPENVGILPGTVATRLDDQVIRQTAQDLLLYIKPIPSFYFSDHQPMICWKGSGYEFSKVEETELDGNMVFQAVLKKPGSTLYTAWWYESNKRRSTSQLDWRWDALRNGSRYYLVNVTVGAPGALKTRIHEVMKARLIH